MQIAVSGSSLFGVFSRFRPKNGWLIQDVVILIFMPRDCSVYFFRASGLVPPITPPLLKGRRVSARVWAHEKIELDLNHIILT